MKRKVIAWLLLLVAVAVCLTVTISAEGEEADNPQTFLEKDDILVTISTVLLSSAAIFIANRPQIRTTRMISGEMLNAVGVYESTKKLTDEKVNDILNKYAEMSRKLEETVKEMQTYKEQQKISSEMIASLLEMVKLGFGSSTELVKKGTAEKICKIYNAIDFAEIKEALKDEKKAV